MMAYRVYNRDEGIDPILDDLLATMLSILIYCVVVPAHVNAHQRVSFNLHCLLVQMNGYLASK